MSGKNTSITQVDEWVGSENALTVCQGFHTFARIHLEEVIYTVFIFL